jgi:hypothetical protein
MDETQQLALFSQAVDLIGGISATARALDINERNVRRILRGDNRLHTGLLGDMAKALLTHANQCRQLERQLSPLYSANLTEAQAKPPLHDGKGPQRQRLPAEQVAEMAARLGIAREG